MKIRSTTLALAAVAVVVPPATADAAAYTPTSVSDPANNGFNDEPATPGVDLVKLSASRANGKITLVTKYLDYRRVNYSIRDVTITDPATSKGRLVRFQTGRPGTTPKVTLYKIEIDGDANTQATLITCSGTRADADASRDRLVVVLPTSCYPGSSSDAAYLNVNILKWTAEDWPNRNGPDGAFADESDGVNTEWSW